MCIRDRLTSGTRYTRRFELDSHGDWAKISVPLSEFVTGENIVNMTEIGTVPFQAAENANLDNNSDDPKAMSADELEEKAVTGCVVIAVSYTHLLKQQRSGQCHLEIGAEFTENCQLCMMDDLFSICLLYTSNRTWFMGDNPSCYGSCKISNYDSIKR